MKSSIEIKPAFTSTLRRVGVSAQRPVHVGSWIADSQGGGDVMPGDRGYPGWHYGSPVSLYEQDKRPHDHAHFEICIVRKGVAIHRTAYSMEELGPRTVTVMAPEMVHAIYSSHDLHQTNLYYLTEWLADDLMGHWQEAAFVPLFLAAALFRRAQAGPIPHFALSPEELDDVDHELASITRELHQAPESLTFLRSCLLKVLILLSRAAVRECNIELSLRFRDDVVAALEYIEGSILRCDSFRVSKLATHLGLTPAHLAMQFQKSTGLSPMAYYQRRRVQHACRLLLDLERSITDIAHELGFCDSAHFTHLFKRYQGVLPSEYRDHYDKTKT